MDEASATYFGKYELLERLGTGGMAVVYRARYTAAPGVSKSVVVKRVLAHYAEDPAFAAMFLNEARISIGLSHGNIVQVFDFGQVDGEYYLAMELVDGQPLSRVLKKARTQGLPSLPAPQAVGIAIEMCRGLHHAHERTDEQGRPLGLVHRDISPDNVLISYGGEVKISDFGIAKARLAGRPETDVGVVKGKYPYFSPEQARGYPLDARSDVYAVGVVLYQMLCGRRPAEGGELEVMQCIAEGRLAPLKSINDKLDQKLVEIVHQALATDLQVRFSTAEALQQALSDWMGQEAPLFRSTALKHLMGWLFQEELASSGRGTRIPAEFLRMVDAWREMLSAPRLLVPKEEARVEAPRRHRLELEPALPPKRQAQSGKSKVETRGSAWREEALSESLPRLEVPGVPAEGDSRSSDSASARVFMGGIPHALRKIAFFVGVAGLVSMGVFWLAVMQPFGQSSVAITSDPAGARILVDGEVRGLTPFILEAGLLTRARKLALVHGARKSWVHDFVSGKLEGVVDVKLAPLSAQAPELPMPGSDGMLPQAQAEHPHQVVEGLPAQMRLSARKHPALPGARARWMVLDPMHTYTAWVPRMDRSFPIPGPVQRGPVQSQWRSARPLIAVLDGVAGATGSVVKVLSDTPSQLPLAGAAYFFFLGALPETQAELGFDVVNVRDEMTMEVFSLGVDEVLHWQEALPGTQFLLSNLDSWRRYFVDVKGSVAAGAGKVGMVTHSGTREAGRNAGTRMQVLEEGRHVVLGAERLEFSRPYDKNSASGAAELEVTVSIAVDTPVSVDTQSLEREVSDSLAGSALEQGMAFRSRGQWRDAQREFRRCVLREPRYARCHRELGRVSNHLADGVQALESYSRYLELEPRGQWANEARQVLLQGTVKRSRK
jgi:serine/threonine protein kinase